MGDFENMYNSTPPEVWEQWALEKGKKIVWEEWFLTRNHEANICIKIAQWRAKAIIEVEREEDILMDAYIQMRDILSLLKTENGYIIEPWDEVETIDLYRNPERLRQKFRSQTLDIFFAGEILRSDDDYKHYQQFRKKLFPYLPPYDVSSD
jgi:hypothetical protein